MSPASPRIGVMGAGAIGCYAGGLLRAAGLDVVFVGRERLRAELAASGLSLTDLSGGSVRVAANDIDYVTDPGVLRGADIVLCCVKSAQTAETGERLAGILGPDAITVSLQNGVRNPTILRSKLGARAVLGGIVSFNVVPLGAGTFRRATTGPLVIEASSDPRIRALGPALSRFGVEMAWPRAIAPLQWSKLIINLNNAVSALSDRPTAALLLDAGYRRILAALMEEALGVLRHAKIALARLGPLPPRLFPPILRLPTPLLRLALRAQLQIDPEARSSMWQDLAAGRSTEVDDLNGEIVRVAREHGTHAPINQRVVELVHEVEAKKAGSPKLSAEALGQTLRLT